MSRASTRGGGFGEGDAREHSGLNNLRIGGTRTYPEGTDLSPRLRRQGKAYSQEPANTWHASEDGRACVRAYVRKGLVS